MFKQRTHCAPAELLDVYVLLAGFPKLGEEDFRASSHPTF